ncbi:MAG TPA: phosphatidate cytidylyltransferase [Phycisphaerae bacterium]|nr:phosphatidate cytidylyltransferase [Phycisphaerales bacterium]HNO79123.1 phosphatidate cytidylyltransferase [Phycisphaerae bacterium]
MTTLLGIVLGVLLLATIVGKILAARATTEKSKRLIANLNARTRAWWIMVLIFSVSICLGGLTTVVLFGLSSFLAFREFVTLTPTRRGDHRALFWAFFAIIPIQYVLIGIQWYGLFAIFIPVYAFLFIPIRVALGGDPVNFLGRTSRVQWGLMVCVYFVSHVPALLMLDIPGYSGRNASLLFFFILIVQMNDVFQYLWGNLFGRRAIAPVISPNKTWEGFIGGLISSTAVGAALYWTTPFLAWQSAALAFAIAGMGFAGDLTMSAVKRDLGVKDYSNMIPGHGGVLDRLDSLSFAAPFFFHLTRYFFTP